MQVVRSRLIGYCHGVSKTIGLAQKCLNQAQKAKLPCYSIGTLIHNADTVKQFEEKGLLVIQEPGENLPGIALIRAHGIPDKLRASFIQAGFTLVDSTCANIQKTKELMQKTAKKHKPIIFLGIKGHAETVCLMETELENEQKIEAILVTSEEDLKQLDSYAPSSQFVIFTQTTFPEEKYKELTTAIQSKFKNAVLGNKLCQACMIRKSKGLELAKSVDVIVVVGGKNSENTKNLASFIRDSGKPVLCIENKNDINEETEAFLRKFQKAGVCSGTSTPIEVIDEVCKHLERLV